MEATPLLKLLLPFAENDLWSRYGITHPNGPDAAGYHMIPQVLDPGALEDLAPRCRWRCSRTSC